MSGHKVCRDEPARLAGAVDLRGRCHRRRRSPSATREPAAPGARGWDERVGGDGDLFVDRVRHDRADRDRLLAGVRDGPVQRDGVLAGPRVTAMLAFTGGQGRRVINTIYPEPYSPRAGASDPVEDRSGTAPRQTLVYLGDPAVVQRFDLHALVTLARTAGAVIDVAPA